MVLVGGMRVKLMNYELLDFLQISACTQLRDFVVLLQGFLDFTYPLLQSVLQVKGKNYVDDMV